MTDKIAVKVSGEDEGVGTLLRTLSKQLALVQKGQAKSNEEAERGSKAQQSLAKSVSSTIANLRRLATAYAVVRTLNFVKDQVDAADALSKLAQKSGISTETLSALAFAGETADVSIEQLGTSAKLFAKSTADLARGSGDAADAFHSLGISAKDLKGLSPDQAFLKTLKTLGSYQDGLEKAEVAQKIFGKSGTDLIPLANQVAEDGFDTISAAAARYGRIVSGDAGRAAEDFNDQLRVLKGQAQGTAFEFSKGVIPALSDAIGALQEMRGEGEKTFAESLGEKAGFAVRKTAVFAITAFKSIGTVLTLLGQAGVDAFDAIRHASKLELPSAKEALQRAIGDVKSIGAVVVTDFNEAQDALDRAEKTRAEKTVAARKKREADEKRRLVLASKKDADELAKARFEAEDHAREGEGKILAANLALRDQAVEQAFAKGLSALSAYFAARRQTIVEAGTQEVAALKASRDAIAKQPVATPVERIQRDDKVAQKNVDIKVAEAKVTEQLNGLDIQRETLAKALQETVTAAEVKIMEARGNTSAAAKASLAEDVENYRIALAKMGQLTAEQQSKRVATFQTTLTLKVDAQAAQEEIDRIFGDIDRKRTALDQEVNIGLRSQVSAQQELTRFEADRLPTLKQLADEMARFAVELGDPTLQAAAADLNVKLESLGTTATKSARLAAEMGTDIADSLEGDLSTFLGSTITQVGSLGEAFASLATSVVGSIQRIVAQLLAAKAVESVARLLGIGASSALPLIDAAGGSAVAGFGFARGGYTGSGGKYQPAGTVHKGEFVFPQEAVRRIGVRQLYELAGLRTPSVVKPRRGYAEGGLVAATVSGGQISGTIDITLQDGMIAQAVDLHMRGPGGEKIVLGHTIRNKGKVGRILGGQ